MANGSDNGPSVVSVCDGIVCDTSPSPLISTVLLLPAYCPAARTHTHTHLHTYAQEGDAPFLYLSLLISLSNSQNSSLPPFFPYLLPHSHLLYPVFLFLSSTHTHRRAVAAYLISVCADPWFPPDTQIYWSEHKSRCQRQHTLSRGQPLLSLSYTHSHTPFLEEEDPQGAGMMRGQDGGDVKDNRDG